MSFNSKKILIIGGNAAGPAAGAQAKRVNPDAEVIMLEAGEFISTGTCEMPYVLSGEINSYKDLVFFDENSFYEKKGVKVFTGHLAETINRRYKYVNVRDLKIGGYKKLEYDKLILATGATPRKPQNIKGSPKNLFYLKKVKDLALLTEYLKNNKVKEVLIVGAGYIGLEAAEAFKRGGYNVTVLDKEPYPLPGAEPEIRRLVLNDLVSNGVEHFCGHPDYSFIIDENNKITALKTEGRIIEFDLVLVSAGFIPETTIAVGAGLSTGSSGAIKTDNKRRTNDPDIYAAGDNSEIINAVTGKPAYFPLATYAREMGRIAGENAAGGNAVSQNIVINSAVKIFDRFYVYTGLTEEEAIKSGFKAKSVYAIAESLVKVMPGSEKIFGKIIFDINSKRILGAHYYGAFQAGGYGDLVSALIKMKAKADTLADIDYNYTPPLSPFTNLLTILGKKIKKEFV